MIESILIIITSLSILLVIYHHIGYPMILKLIQRKLHQHSELAMAERHYASSDNDKQLPSLTLIVPAYNEQQWIADKIYNCTAIDYPADRLTIIIACDGCTDNTVGIAHYTLTKPACQDLNIEVRDFSENRGKVAVLNDVINSVNSDLVALSDVSALISLDAFLIAATQFKTKKLGVINSHYCLLDPGSVGEANYWNYQSKIKLAESELGSTLGAHGALYIFRRELFTPLAADTINDDFILPMTIVAGGYVAKQDNRIVAVELEQANSSMDWQRRVRIATGNMQQVLRLKNMLHPHYGGIAFNFASGKALRVLMPFLMLISLIGSIMLAPYHLAFVLLAGVQILLYVLAGLQLTVMTQSDNKLLKVLAYLVSGHLAGLVGALSYLFTDTKTPWKPVYSTTQSKENDHEH